MNLQTWFEKGMTFAEYLSSMEVNQKEVTRVYDKLSFTEEDLATFKQLSERNLRGIVLTADWCGDAALNVPVFQRIAQESNMELRFLIRDENLELMDQYLTNGTSRAIPIFIFIDETGNEAAVWGPRSPEVQTLIIELRTKLPEKEAADFKEKERDMYLNFKEMSTTDPSIWRTVIDSAKQRLEK
jgi:Thioredoxin